MKKFLALILCLLMALSMTAAVAEEAPAVLAEELYEGVWVQFEDGFEFYLPAGWVEYELTTEANAMGLFYAAGSEDGVYLCTLGWQPLEAEVTIEKAQTLLAASYPTATLTDVNGVGMVYYMDEANNTLNFVALDGAEPGFYVFAFTPGNDEDFQVLAALIASTIRNF